MRLFSISSVAAILACSVCSSSLAQGLGPQLYFGGGIERSSVNITETTLGFGNDENEVSIESDRSAHPVGIVGLAGYKINLGYFFYAGEVDISIPVSGDIDDESGQSVLCGEGFGLCSVNWTSRTRVLTGITAQGNDYFTSAGAVVQNVEFSDPNGRSSDTVVGVTLGVGAQFEVRRNVDVRFEVIHDIYDRGSASNDGADSEWKVTTVRAAAIFEF